MSTKRMLIDAAHPEETRVVVLNGNKLDEFDVEVASRKQLKGNIYLAKVVRVEPSLQAAFVDYGGNRHGFLSFNEIHPDYYQIPVADREALVAAHDAATQRTAEEAPEPASEAEAASPSEPIETETAEPTDSDVRAEELSSESQAEAETGSPQEESSEREAAPLHAAPAESVTTEPAPSDSGEAASEAPPIEGEIVTVAPAATPVETLGGDDREEVEVRRPHHSPRNYRIQEVIKRRQILLVQVVKEERGNKGAALTTYLSLAGRYCVLMPNTARGGGVSRKITSGKDRDRLKKILSDLDIPEGMGVIVRTAGMDKTKTEIKRDCTYLLKLWDSVREMTLKSVAPCLVYEESGLIKRSIRDVYSNAISEVLVQGDEAFRVAKDLMKLLIPSHAKRVQQYTDTTVPLLQRFKVEGQLDATHNPVVQLPSGGYIVINPTEALVAIDVNSGRATRERNIEETALRTNLEAAEEVARQLRLRDLAGLIVIDFIDMESSRNNAKVERQLKEAMRGDRARIQLGKISPFGLLELSRQRLRPSLFETSFEPCPHCSGTGILRSIESAALHVLRHIEEEGVRLRNGEITIHVPTKIALYILNQQRGALGEIEKRYEFSVTVSADDTLIPPNFRLDHRKGQPAPQQPDMPITAPTVADDEVEEIEEEEQDTEAEAAPEGRQQPRNDEEGGRRRRRRRRRRGRGGENGEHRDQPHQQRPHPEPIRASETFGDDLAPEEVSAQEGEGRDGQEQSQRPERGQGEEGQRRRRRGRRGGRRRNRRNGDGRGPEAQADAGNQYREESQDAGSVDFQRREDSAPQPHGDEAAQRESEPTYAAPREPVEEPAPLPSRSEPAEVMVTEKPSAPAPVEEEPPAKPRRGWWDRLTR
jgi:ribonuclease E